MGKIPDSINIIIPPDQSKLGHSNEQSGNKNLVVPGDKFARNRTANTPTDIQLQKQKDYVKSRKDILKNLNILVSEKKKKALREIIKEIWINYVIKIEYKKKTWTQIHLKKDDNELENLMSPNALQEKISKIGIQKNLVKIYMLLTQN